MGLRALLQNLTKLVLMGLGGVLGALVVVWARANSEWATICLPAVMVPGSNESVEYEAKVYAIVALSFAAGVLSCFWIALTVWIRSVGRERRLARALESLEAQVAETRGLHLKEYASPSIHAGESSTEEPHYDDFEELEHDDSIAGLLSDAVGLPEGYDDACGEYFEDEIAEDELGSKYDPQPRSQEPEPQSHRKEDPDRG